MIRLQALPLVCVVFLAMLVLPASSASPASPTSALSASTEAAESAAPPVARPGPFKPRVRLKQRSATFQGRVIWSSKEAAEVAGTLRERCSGPRSKAKLSVTFKGRREGSSPVTEVHTVDNRCGRSKISDGYGMLGGISSATVRLCEKGCSTKVYFNPRNKQ